MLNLGGVPMKRVPWFVLVFLVLSSSAWASPTLKRFDATYTINPDYTYTVRTEIAQVAESREELDELTRLAAQIYARGREEVRLIEAYTLKTDGTKLPVRPDQVFRQARQASSGVPIFDDTEIAQVTFPNVGVGDTAVAVWEKVVKIPSFPKHFFTSDYVCGCRKVEYNRLVFRFPANLPVKVYARGRYVISEKTSGGIREITALLEDFPFISKEPGQPGDQDSSPNFLVASTFASWEEVGAAYWARAKDKVAVTPEVRRIAEEAAAGATGLQAVENLYNWVVQNIRYVGIFLGDGGYVPVSAQETLSTRYGDCKAYTTLLQALLAARGIKSVPVLVYLGNDGYTSLPGPTPAQFNHAMLYVPEFNLYLDPTSQNHFGTLVPEARGKFAVLAGEEPRQVITPTGQASSEIYRQQSRYSVSPDGTLIGTATLSVEGGMARAFKGLVTADPAATARNILARFAEGGSGTLIVLDSSLQYKFTANWETPNLLQVGDLLSFGLPQGIALFYLNRFQELVTLPTRKNPLVLGARTDERSYRLVVPEGYRLLRVPNAVEISTTAGSYTATYTIDGAELVVQRKLVLNKDVYMPGEYPALRELIQKMLQDLRTPLVFSK
ncbi:MAG: transglutaminase [Meiothermus sp.]|nr:MAG: transglutaminase [Meiothermus sp.]